MDPATFAPGDGGVCARNPGTGPSALPLVAPLVAVLRFSPMFPLVAMPATVSDRFRFGVSKM